ncbi:MAG: hypothetical protein L6420_08740 [Elusimicrobia bacterium]|nr:hypothetical protein [Elusimicrobiota bacterium]
MAEEQKARSQQRLKKGNKAIRELGNWVIKWKYKNMVIREYKKLKNDDDKLICKCFVASELILLEFGI